MSESVYREPARAIARIERAQKREPVLGPCAVVAGVVVAAQAGLWPALGVGALAAFTHTWSRLRARRHAEALAAFLRSDEVEVGPGTWTSPDGRRRVRGGEDGRVRFEHLDPSTGETLASFRAPAPIGPDPRSAEVMERAVAEVRGRVRAPRCFTGLPPALGGAPAPTPHPCHAVLEVRRDGVLLSRRDADGACVGDTLHADLASALRQLEAEHGEHVGAFRRSAKPAARSRRTSAWDRAERARLDVLL